MHPGQKATALFDIGAAPKKVIICSVDPQGPLSKMLDIQPTGKSSNSQQAKLESPKGTKPDEKGKAVGAASITGGWFCDSTGEDGNAKVAFLFNGSQFSYRIGNSMSLTSYDYKASGARGSGTFQEIAGNGGSNNNASVPYELSFSSASPEKLVFDLKITAQKGVASSKNECVPLEGNPAPKSKQ